MERATWQCDEKGKKLRPELAESHLADQPSHEIQDVCSSFSYHDIAIQQYRHAYAIGALPLQSTPGLLLSSRRRVGPPSHHLL